LKIRDVEAVPRIPKKLNIRIMDEKIKRSTLYFGEGLDHLGKLNYWGLSLKLRKEGSEDVFQNKALQ
jgi:hypothetical protein